MRTIFSDEFVRTQVAMRGGTVLHKVHLAPAARYSEDIDLVVVGDRPEEHVRKALMRVLRPILGREQSWVWTHLKLAVRNATQKSRIVRCTYKMPSVVEVGWIEAEIQSWLAERITTSRGSVDLPVERSNSARRFAPISASQVSSR